MKRQHVSIKAETPYTSVHVDSGEVPALDTEPAVSALVGSVLEELRIFGRLKTLKISALSAEELRAVCTTIKQDVLTEIKSGNTVFEPEELEVAFELELQRFGLHKAYTKVLESAVPPRAIQNEHRDTNRDGTNGRDTSTVGFSKIEIKRIPRHAREAINLRFSQMTIQGRAKRSVQGISESDAACISDIVRILLTHQDSFGQQFRDRLGLSDKMIWKLLSEHDIDVLGSDEREALVVLAEVANGLDALKEKLLSDVIELQIQSLRHMVLYRRLIRLEHAPDEQAQLQKVMDALELSANEYASAEHVTFAGMSNHNLAPDLFPDGEDTTYLLDLIAELQGSRTQNATVKLASPAMESGCDSTYLSDLFAASQGSRTLHPTIKLSSPAMGSGCEGDIDAYPKEFENYNIVTATAHQILNWYPKPTDPENYPASMSMPGSDHKIDDLARRVRLGLPLWHPGDRTSYDFLGAISPYDIAPPGPRRGEETDEEPQEDVAVDDEVEVEDVDLEVDEMDEAEEEVE